MINLIRQSLFGLLIILSACSSGKEIGEEPELPETPTSRAISVEVNERFRFNFKKQMSPEDSVYWIGDAVEYTFTPQGEKVAQGRFSSANDSTWNDFDLFVEYLRIFDLPDQSAIQGRSVASENARLTYRVTLKEDDEERVIIYKDPADDLQKFWQSQNFYVFISFIENELNWLPAPMESPERKQGN
ncbi:hypothetical protein AB2B38_013070 [Balneola sp. MJW-20]|uniref:hypothetical protein n=1 Tax=Gracilimonas aurantiaca TaxID=3234185 RepID=UPI003464F535